MNRLFGTSKDQPKPVVQAPPPPNEAPKTIDLSEQAQRVHTIYEFVSKKQKCRTSLRKSVRWT
jgi:hypothetical protein